MLDPTGALETWLLQRVARAVEAGHVSADLLTELQGEIAGAQGRPPEERQAVAVQELAERFALPVDQLEDLLAALEAQPNVTRELLLRRVVEAWLVQQREAYETREHGD